MKQGVSSTDAIVEVLCEEMELATSHTELSLIEIRVMKVGKMLDFSDMQWEILHHYQTVGHMRVG